MALVKAGAGLSDISGKVGGVVYRRNRFGLCACAFVNPVNPNTTRQSTARSRLSNLAANWNEVLTEAQRQQWNQYAANVPWINRLGDTTYLSGFNMYCRSNAAILAAGGTVVANAPAEYTLPAQDETFDISISAATGEITVTFDDTRDWCDENGGFLSLQMGLPKQNNVSFFGGPWQSIGAIAGDSVTPPSTGDAKACSYEVQEGQLVWVRARIIRADGRTSGWFRAECSVAA